MAQVAGGAVPLFKIFVPTKNKSEVAKRKGRPTVWQKHYTLKMWTFK
jgi:hypothetical protein